MGPSLAALTKHGIADHLHFMLLFNEFNKMHVCCLFLLELANLQDGALLP